MPSHASMPRRGVSYSPCSPLALHGEDDGQRDAGSDAQEAAEDLEYADGGHAAQRLGACRQEAARGRVGSVKCGCDLAAAQQLLEAKQWAQLACWLPI